MANAALKYNYFAGAFDPEGRPWTRLPGEYPANYSDYKTRLVNLLKLAMLTQVRVILPAGYFFDNPALHHILPLAIERSSRVEDPERTAFRNLLRDVVHVFPNISGASSASWREMFLAWVRGKGRGAVYMNCLTPEDALEIQGRADFLLLDEIESKMERARPSLSIMSHLDTLEELNLRRHASTRPLPLDELVREHLLSGRESFHGVTPEMLEKIQAIQDACNASDHRLSRSVLNSHAACRSLSIPDRYWLRPDELNTIGPVITHYHHFAMASCLGLGAFVTHVNPRVAHDRVRQVAWGIDSLARDAVKACPRVSVLPLETLTFGEIERIRHAAGSMKFEESLMDIHRLTAEGAPGAQIACALRDHERLIKSALRIKLRTEGISDTLSSIEKHARDGTIVTPGLQSLGWTVLHGKDWRSVSSKRRAVRMVLRKIGDAIESEAN